MIIPEINIEFHEVFSEEENFIISSLEENGFNPEIIERYESEEGDPFVIVQVMKESVVDNSTLEEINKSLLKSLKELKDFLPKVVEGEES